MRFVSGDEILGLTNAAELVPVVEDGLARLARQEADQPERLHLAMPEYGASLLVMPARLPGLSAVTVKIATVHPDNPGRGLPTTQALVLLMDDATGASLAVFAGTELTQLRTGAVAALAADRLAPPQAARLAVIGTGRQAAGAVEALVGRRRGRLSEVRVWSRDAHHRADFVAAMNARFHRLGWALPLWYVAASAREAVHGADIVVTATTSDTPVFSAGAIEAPCHVIALGAYRRGSQEVETALVARAQRVVVETLASAQAEAGDLIAAADEGMLDWSKVQELARIPRTADMRRGAGLTLFKSVGVGVLDTAVAMALWRRLQGWSDPTSPAG